MRLMVFSHHRGWAIVVVLLQCAQLMTTLAQKSNCALTVVEKTEGGITQDDAEAMVTEDSIAEEHPEVVQPTDQWQTLKPGQAVPIGSHVRLNLQTGQREVRLGEEQMKYWIHTRRQKKADAESYFGADELKHVLKKIKEDSGPLNKDSQDQNRESKASQFRPLEELKRDMAELELLVETDVQVLRRLLDQLNSTNSTTEGRLQILLELEYLVHQVDNAQTLCSMGGLKIILGGLNSSDYRLQESSAFVLGSALASNPTVQVEVVERGGLQKLLVLLATPRPLSVKKKVLFAAASLLRHFPYAQRYFLSHGGLQVLSELFHADARGALRVRIVTLLSDIITEKELISQAAADQTLDSTDEELLRQYSKVSLYEGLLEGGWCSLVRELLDSTEHDWREKGLQAMLAMSPVCLERYRLDVSLPVCLGSLKVQYQKLANRERTPGEGNGGYFEEILDLLNMLELKLK